MNEGVSSCFFMGGNTSKQPRFSPRTESQLDRWVDSRRKREWGRFEEIGRELKERGVNPEKERANEVSRIRQAEDQENARIRASNELYLAEQNRERQQRRDTSLCCDVQGSRVLVLGMLAAGKSSFMRWLGDDSQVKVGEPTTGLLIEEVGFSRKCNAPEGIHALSWHLSRNGEFRSIKGLLEVFYGGRDGLPCVRGLVWMVDAAWSFGPDAPTFQEESGWDETKTMLWWYLKSEKLRDLPLLILANKKDKPFAISPEEVAQRMGLGGGGTEGLTEYGSVWAVFSTSLTSQPGSHGTDEAMAWLSKHMQNS